MSKVIIPTYLPSCFISIYTLKSGILFSLRLCSIWYVETIGHIVVRRSYSFLRILHYPIISILKNYLKTLTLYNTCPVHSVESVFKIMSILSLIFYETYGTVGFQLTYFAWDHYENMCTLPCYRHQIRNITPNHCLGLSHETMVCTDCLACLICAWFALVAFCCGLWFPKCYCCSSEINGKCIKLIKNNKPQKICVHIW